MPQAAVAVITSAVVVLPRGRWRRHLMCLGWRRHLLCLRWRRHLLCWRWRCLHGDTQQRASAGVRARPADVFGTLHCRSRHMSPDSSLVIHNIPPGLWRPADTRRQEREVHETEVTQQHGGQRGK